MSLPSPPANVPDAPVVPVAADTSLMFGDMATCQLLGKRRLKLAYAAFGCGLLVAVGGPIWCGLTWGQFMMDLADYPELAAYAPWFIVARGAFVFATIGTGLGLLHLSARLSEPFDFRREIAKVGKVEDEQASLTKVVDLMKSAVEAVKK